MGAIPDIENMVKLGRYFDNDQGINKHNTDVKKVVAVLFKGVSR